MRTIPGRAGSGKSRVLSHLFHIAENMGVNVIGLAPTHKAREVLRGGGYTQTDTIKGMLFKLFS